LQSLLTLFLLLSITRLNLIIFKQRSYNLFFPRYQELKKESKGELESFAKLESFTFYNSEGSVSLLAWAENSRMWV
ncbi:hypothetical protein LEMLEM_LOCUS5908, partial [Lemmus lemmus]